MSKYTTELRYILESGNQLPLDNYPIWDESYRSTLNQFITNHFYFREIGIEPYGKFAMFLERKMNEIMPFYNEIYLRRADFLYTHSITITDNTEYDGKSTTGASSSENGTTNTTAEDKQYSSDTPMGSLGNVYSEQYATTSGVGNSTANSISENKSNQFSENHSESSNDKIITRKGNEGQLPLFEVIKKYHDEFMSIDMMICNDLEVLFMGLW